MSRFHQYSDEVIAAARDVVIRPEACAAQPALRENAWRTLVEARGGSFAAHRLPVVTHATPGRPAAGVAAHLSKRVTLHDTAPQSTAFAPDLVESLRRAQPAINAAIARHNARLRDTTPPTGGSAA